MLGNFNETLRRYDEMFVLYNDPNDIEAFFLVKAWNMGTRFYTSVIYGFKFSSLNKKIYKL